MNSAGHTSVQPYTYSEVPQQDASPLEAPRPVSAPAPGNSASLVIPAALSLGINFGLHASSWTPADTAPVQTTG